jgi:hypothetical protein
MDQHIYHRLHIPEPCHEDWSKMTPDEKGAFCKSCNKSVHDFTKKTEDEVAAIITESTAKGEKVCGRFNRWQLGATPDIIIPLHALPRTLSPFKAFAASVFIVFGTMLFNITNANGQAVEQVKLLVPDTSVQKIHAPMLDSLPGASELKMEELHDLKLIPSNQRQQVNLVRSKRDTIHARPVPYTFLGAISEIKHHEAVKDTFAGDSLQTGNYQNAVIDSIGAGLRQDSIPGEALDHEWLLEPAEVMGSSIVCEVDSLWPTLGYTVIVVGNVGVEPSPVPGLFPVVPEEDTETGSGTLFIAGSEHLPIRPAPPANSVEHRNNEGIGNQPLGGEGNDLFCYPNPSAGPVTVNYVIDSQCDAVLELCDLSGHRIKTLLDIKSHHHGIYHTEFDLSHLSPGTYTIILRKGGNAATTRLVIAR